jgi:two-component system, OmpR family, sensor kinase
MALVRILRRKHPAAQQLLKHREPSLMRDQPEQVRADILAVELADLRQQVAQLRDAVRARDDFIVIAAHELRNPMTPIMAVAELALKAARDAESACPPRVTTLLERMQLLAQDFIQRSTRLLDVSRIEAGNLQLRPAATDLSALVLSVTQKYDATAAHRRSPVKLDVKGGVTGILDRLAIEQVVENLLSNAFKFGAGESVTVRLRSDGRSAQLDVQDQGIGMSPDQQARIFGRFEQVIAQHRGPGFGVGLWLANCLVAAMDGQITVSSHIGEGSTFTVILPLAPPGPDGTPHDAA